MTAMWEPDPSWQPLPGGRGALTVGLWLVPGDESWVAKRVRRPAADEPPSLWEPTHPGYWRRELELARSDLDGAAPTAGLARPSVHSAEEDDEGYTVVSAHVAGERPPGPFAAVALGQLAASPVEPQPWHSRQLLRRRLELAEERDGWPTMARTTVADLAHELWRRRHTILERYDELPQRLSHGDATPANLVSNGRVVTALDWSSCGLAPAGADLGYLSLSGREDLDVLVAAQMTAMPDGNVDDVRFAAQTMAVYTVMSQAEWALARAARGPGALAGKYRHPAVAPYLHALQRQFGSIEALLA